MQRKSKRFHLRNIHSLTKVRLQIIPAGYMALQVLEPTWLTGKQIETARRIIKRTVSGKFGDELLINYVPNKVLTAKSKGIRMGKGKGSVLSAKICQVKSGSILFSCLFKADRLKFFKKAIKKLSVKAKILLPSYKI